VTKIKNEVIEARHSKAIPEKIESKVSFRMLAIRIMAALVKAAMKTVTRKSVNSL